MAVCPNSGMEISYPSPLLWGEVTVSTVLIARGENSMDVINKINWKDWRGCAYTFRNAHEIVSEKEAMNLEERKEGYTGGYREGKGENDIIIL